MISKLDISREILIWLVLAIILGELYSLAQGNLNFDPVINAGLVTSTLALLFGIYWWKLQGRNAFSLKVKAYWWLLGFSPVLGATALSLITGEGSYRQVGELLELWPHIFWIPIAEEILYRGVLSSWLKSRSTRLLGSYGSSVIFCLMHADFTWRSLWEWNLFAPLGPLLLAWCAEFIFSKTGRLWLCIAFHASCNATIVVFQLIDPRWLEWLEALYL